MFSVSHPFSSVALTRRQALQVGALGSVGLSLSQLLQAEAASRTGRPKSCILIFANGGPAQLDTFDMKPAAPLEIRGEFKPIATSVPGIHICEHLPRLARLADSFALVRSVTHKFQSHPAAAYIALTGHPPARDGLFPARPEDFPAIGSVLASASPANPALPSYVVEPHLSYDVGMIQPGQLAGFLGAQGQPFVVEADLSRPNFSVKNMTLGAGLDAERLASRRRLTSRLDAQLPQVSQTPAARNMASYQEKAFNLLNSSATAQAFQLDHEPDGLRNQYGRHPYGQSYLLARRLIEAGVRMVMVNDSDGKANDRWDTHSGSFRPLRNHLPQTDAALAALLSDLKQRGLLDTTLVVWMGEMGRTPKAPHADHWPMAYSILMAGGGIRGGQTYGSTDRHAAYPRDNPVSPGDILATIYHAMGLAADTMIHDRTNRPHRLFNGQPITALFG